MKASRKELHKLTEAKTIEQKRLARSQKVGRETALKGGMGKMEMGYFSNQSSQSGGKNLTRLDQAIHQKQDEVKDLKLAYQRPIHLELVSTTEQQSLVKLENAKVFLKQNELLSIPEFFIFSGQKIHLQGPNGSGKTSFLKILLLVPDYELNGPQVFRNPNLKMAYLSQHLDLINPHLNLISNLQVHLPSLSEKSARTILANLHFTSQKPYLQASNLSGGELLKLNFAILTAMETNLLILDEPTNNLDFEAIQVLVENLQNFPAAYLAVSHNTFLLAQLDFNQVYTINNQTISKNLT